MTWIVVPPDVVTTLFPFKSPNDLMPLALGTMIFTAAK